MPLITIVAPASWESQDHSATIISFFKKLGFDVQFSLNAFSSERFMAGSDTLRAQDLMQAFQDPETDIIMALKGGYGSPRILDKLDYTLIRQNKKPFFGFSDNTALQLALYKKSDLPSLTGFNANFALKAIEDPLLKSLIDALQNKPVHIKDLIGCTKGVVRGPLIGGNLTMIHSLLGTPYMPSMKGVIWVIEEVHEEPYRIDRMLTSLRLSGIFDQLGGVLIGRFTGCTPKDQTDGTVEEVLKEHFGALKIPVAYNFPYGHDMNHIVFPIGTEAILDANKGTLDIAPPVWPLK